MSNPSETPETCCACPSGVIVYRNYRGLPFCAPCADGDQPDAAGIRPSERVSAVQRVNSCGTVNTHRPEWRVSLTSPEGRTGIEILQCDACLMTLLRTPAVQRMGRTVNVRAYGGAV